MSLFVFSDFFDFFYLFESFRAVTERSAANFFEFFDLDH